nr:hypothetical protein [Nanoarchaeota archaeon]
MAKHLLTNNKSLLIMAGVDKKEVLELSEYLKSMSSRLQSLQRTSGQISNHISQFITSTDTKKRTLMMELEDIKKDVGELREEVRSVQKVILGVINQLKSSIKTEELERFKKRMDLWNPEKFMTRKEVERVLKEI